MQFIKQGKYLQIEINNDFYHSVLNLISSPFFSVAFVPLSGESFYSKHLPLDCRKYCKDRALGEF